MLICATLYSCQLTSNTASSEESISSGSRITRALGVMVDASARGVLRTRVRPTHGLTRLAGEVTLLVLATVIVCPALHIDTGHQGVTLETSRAHTLGRVELNNALSSATTRPVRVEAGVETVLIDAGLVDRTVIVCATLRSVALAVGVAPVARRTGAHWMVRARSALGLRRARAADHARVNAALVDAGLGLGTVWVLSALGSGLN